MVRMPVPLSFFAAFLLGGRDSAGLWGLPGWPDQRVRAEPEGHHGDCRGGHDGRCAVLVPQDGGGGGAVGGASGWGHDERGAQGPAVPCHHAHLRCGSLSACACVCVGVLSMESPLTDS